eukprot:Cvel_14938.t1-p1 / transcript=Cvel_14938.t1 / gene=Cvel_14938 / organism=Chromera_velia_CCMP2878 / gene_product=hypothetical protein / transcript_product=hypothetical protein / location=Cvel_scaffold1083:55843-57239(+) / protein_length=321 / sequence_SO=supercontig / SO=protein_coding / is_pseudo=false
MVFCRCCIADRNNTDANEFVCVQQTRHNSLHDLYHPPAEPVRRKPYSPQQLGRLDELDQTYQPRVLAYNFKENRLLEEPSGSHTPRGTDEPLDPAAQSAYPLSARSVPARKSRNVTPTRGIGDVFSSSSSRPPVVPDSFLSQRPMEVPPWLSREAEEVPMREGGKPDPSRLRSLYSDFLDHFVQELQEGVHLTQMLAFDEFQDCHVVLEGHGQSQGHSLSQTRGGGAPGGVLRVDNKSGRAYDFRLSKILKLIKMRIDETNRPRYITYDHARPPAVVQPDTTVDFVVLMGFAGRRIAFSFPTADDMERFHTGILLLALGTG